MVSMVSVFEAWKLASSEDPWPYHNMAEKPEGKCPYAEGTNVGTKKQDRGKRPGAASLLGATPETANVCP